jgi:hypothetical protein
MFSILRQRHSAQPSREWILVHPKGAFLSLSENSRRACLFVDQRDAAAAARALTGDGAHGKWTVVPAPEKLRDIRG